jgi:Baseplate J-like protein
MVHDRRQLMPAYILSAVIVAVAALGSLMLTETASVKLTVPPQKLVATATLSGSPTGGDLKTQHIDAAVTDTQVGTATIVSVPAKYAAGDVVFSCATSECPSTFTVPSGTLLATDRSLGYFTQSDAVVTTTRQGRAAVRATAAGASWNTGRNTVTVINNSSQFPNGLHVTNPAAIAGGADASSAQVIQQSDWDGVRAALAARVSDALDVALKAKAPQMSYIENGPPALTVSSNRKVGEMVTLFTMTMRGTVGATAFYNSEAISLIRAALEAKIPAGQQLISESVQVTWHILQTNPNGDVTVSGTALGYVTPRLSTATLRDRIRGLSTADARRSLERAVPGSSVEIRISPVAVPWLPLVAEHISITVLVQPLGP